MRPNDTGTSATGGATSTDDHGRQRIEAAGVRSAQRSSAKDLTALIGTLSEGVLFVDNCGDVLCANQSFCDIFGFDQAPEDLIGTSRIDLKRQAWDRVQDPVGFFEAVESAYRLHSESRCEIVAMVDGRVFERDFVKVEQSSDTFYSWIYRDVTERTAQAEQSRLLLDRERNLRVSTEEQNRALTALNRMRSEFMATLSHELRTPLTSIISFSEILTEEASSLNYEELGFLKIIARNAQKLLDLVTDLLLVTQVDSGVPGIVPELIELTPFVDNALTTFRATASRVGLSLTFTPADDREPILIDPKHFELVIVNLVTNAVKFTPAGGFVSVTTRRGDQCWLIEVADTGIGIPPEEVDLLGNRFYRASNAKRNGVSGTGLGLAITKAVVESHGGTLHIAPRAVGTVVTIAIPDARAHAASPAASGSARISLADQAPVSMTTARESRDTLRR
ncbi:unannotated protein [freshwater metagenome]|uniref:histidine kinase n=1 Tax=freshwater metagenome TaxID=449393 RepID=A0A6J7FL23_9ZZZZ